MGGQAIRDLQIMKQFGKQLREQRVKKSLTQEELALKAGVSQSQVGRIECGKLNTTISTADN
jgi:transcriptional regulator with XRE-family HTH domain